jgi:hypothetical protein
MKHIMLIILSLILFGCTDEGSSRSALRKAGYTNIVITGWEPFTCGEDDTFSTGFRAKNPAGTVVSGTVCCGLIAKACTIRF